LNLHFYRHNELAITNTKRIIYQFSQKIKLTHPISNKKSQEKVATGSWLFIF
jgi:hypothetical protein